MSELRRIEIYLVPGFLGFSKLSEAFNYFIDVPQLLRRVLRSEFNIEAHIRVTSPHSPTGRLEARASELSDFIAAHHQGGSVHLVGHSTGGLDIRLLLSRPSTGAASFIPEVKTAIGVATPHRGTPLATVADRVGMDRLIRVLSLRPVIQGIGRLLRFLRVPLGWVSEWPIDPFLERLIEGVLVHEPELVQEWLAQIGEDAGALYDLQPEAMANFNMVHADRDGVRYANVVTGTSPPSKKKTRREVNTREFSPSIALNTVVYRLFQGVIARAPLAETETTAAIVRHARGQGAVFGGLEPTIRTSDGIVPTFSQSLEGHRLLGVFASDHLDCVGHYPHTSETDGSVLGWVHSGASFDCARFERLWGEIARFIAEVELEER